MTRLKIGEAMPNDAKATPVAIEPEGDWFNLYKGSTSRDDHLFTAESVRHPAKMSLALTNKILDTMQEWGWIEPGSLVVDPFGGRGTTALCWLARNAANRALTVELEPHFVEMQNRNKEHAQRRLHRELAWVILQGDSRRFDEYYAEGKAASILSPPYEAQSGGTGPASEKGYMAERGMQQYHAASNTNLGYAEGKAASVLSAPYADVLGHRCQYTDPEKAAADDARDIIKSTLGGQPSIYGQTPGQIGNLPDSAITSAPYSGDLKHDRTFAERDARADETKDLTNACGRGSFRGSPTYGETPGQIGGLPDPPAASVLSAPYETAVQDKSGIDPTKFRTQGGRYGQTSQAIAGGYQSSASVLSAPYAAAENRRAAGKVQEGEVSDAITRAYDATNHGQTAGNIANLPDACVTSAPWERTVATGDPDFLTPGEQGKRVPSKSNMAGYTDAAAVTSAPYADSQTSDAQRQLSGNKPVSETIAKRKANVGNGNEETSYGTAEGQIARLPDNQQGQIGVLQSETYAQACGLVYASLAKAGIRYVASVTKDPTGQPKGIKFCKCGSAPKGRKNG